MGIANYPDVRQRDEYSCGAAQSMAAGVYRKVGPATLPEWKKLLGTNVEKSTDPLRIISAFQGFGRKVTGRPMTVSDLKNFVDQDIPVICPVQDYGPVRSKKAQYNYGHYLTVLDVFMDNKYILCQDSSEDNVIKPGSDSIQAPGKIVIGVAEWMKVWHDRDLYDKPYINYGIAIG